MPRVRKPIFAAVAAAGLLGLSGLAASSAAHAASTPGGEGAPTTCKSWDDGTTYSVSCDSGTYSAAAKCSNGDWLKDEAKVHAPASSYVYCSSVGATYVAGTGFAGMDGGG